MEDRIISSEVDPGELPLETSLRPQTLKQYIGQEKVKENLAVFIEAAKLRQETLDHVLLFGPPGLGRPLQRLLLMKWVFIFGQRQDLRSNGRVT